MEIIAKVDGEITPEDIEFLRQNYTSAGGLIPNAYSGGAFFTPTHVARFIVEALRGLAGGFAPGTRFLEPSCGSGVFLEHLPEDAEITALEMDRTSARVSSLLYPHADVIECDALTHTRRDYYDFVIGNPPYGLTVEVDESSDFTTLSKSKGKLRGKSENAFLEFAVRCAKPGGYVAFVLPIGVGFSQNSKKIRELLHDTCWHVSTIMLPGETFQHVGTTIPTQILIVRKAPPSTRLIPSAEKRWGSNFKRGGYEDITQFDAKFLEGQTPSYFAKITNIGWDAKGNRIEKWGDGFTQLDELLDDFTNTLMRENLYPHIPSWHGLKDVTSFMFSHGNDSCDG
ncbi:class I SAM-dependent DNA methyltransferase [Paenibacillus alvei]|uniref:HsdM family class I SAM-dependent methyltransferase n=1 Tax=Paenibacillus alvei TaxID=44250 RepID=UPI0018CCA6F6|nr:N-6 DNA methylase [Paenibacillus alvei]MBG9736447.1 hypothetical protein [Paenibacillus alvei]MBG9736477.1 hypothetical protein [Paenibacillus alvei]MBG9736523.1 hypothetical protein [Paenibacillus alvei]MBG9736588.1 hypothetical protein [Paenibacillus alvei]MBG9745572.1 hypothetical protein [Paenibacillus alvei]